MRQGLLQPGLALNSCFSCLYLPSAGIIGICHHTWLHCLLLRMSLFFSLNWLTLQVCWVVCTISLWYLLIFCRFHWFATSKYLMKVYRANKFLELFYTILNAQLGIEFQTLSILHCKGTSLLFSIFLILRNAVILMNISLFLAPDPFVASLLWVSTVLVLWIFMCA